MWKAPSACVLLLLAAFTWCLPAGGAETEAAAWPHAISVNGATVEVYQPQAIAWRDHEVLTARVAIAITQGTGPPLLGTIELTLNTHTDAGTSLVSLSDPKLLATHFPSLDTAQATRIEDKIREALPGMQFRQVPLQSVLLSLKQTAAPESAALLNQPPRIFYSDKPASLVVFDGEPVLAPAGKSGLSFAVNTNWDVFTDGKAWYLLNNSIWLEAPAYAGPYHPVTHLPPAFNAIPADQNFASVRGQIPPKSGKPAIVPAIMVSTKPADIIVTDGPPQFAPIPGTGIQAVKNSSADLFWQPSSGQFFLLISGRWFSSASLSGPWTFATGKLPPDFAMIHADSPQAHVLSSVPGTSQAELAVLQAQVPRQATLKRDSAKVEVVYAGKPEFKPIPGTSLMYAVNTPAQVIETGGKYYVCYQGAWFVGPSPTGPWALATAVPEVIYTIPPSSPLYNVTYVKVYGSTPTTVTYGYTSGYMMGYVSTGVVVYGTGYYYPPVVIPGPVPVFYPYPYTYTGSVWYNTANGAWVHGGTAYGWYGGEAKGGTYYNPSTGAWGRGGAIYGPNGGAGAFSYYNPSTGGYARGSASWYGGSGYAQASYYNPRTGASGSTQQNWNPYSRWGSSTISGPNQTINTASGSNARGSAGAFQSSTGAQGAGYRGVNGNQGGVVKTQGGDTYAGHDGNVYQHSSSGWSKWNDGGWQPVNPPSNNTQSAQRTTQSAQRNSQPGGTAATQSQGSRFANRSSASGTRSSLDTSTYQQLEQDRQARWSGGQGRFSGGGSGRFGEGQFQERSGGGRFRR